jgi:hypothetical protein
MRIDIRVSVVIRVIRWRKKAIIIMPYYFHVLKRKADPKRGSWIDRQVERDV